MKTINTIRLASLRNNEHFQFMTDFNQLVNNFSAAELLIDSSYPEFENLLEQEQIANGIIQGSNYTQQIAELDNTRDNTWNAITHRIETYMISPNESEVKHATYLYRILEKFGDVRTLPYNAESGAISTFLNDILDQDNNASVAADEIGLTDWLNLLKTQNEEFQSLFNQRYGELADKESGNVKLIRNKIDKVYRKMVDRINASIIMEMAKETTPSFIDKLNEQIDYFKNTLKIRQAIQKEDSLEQA